MSLSFFFKQGGTNLKDLHHYVLIIQTKRVFLCVTQVTDIASETIGTSI